MRDICGKYFTLLELDEAFAAMLYPVLLDSSGEFLMAE